MHALLAGSSSPRWKATFVLNTRLWLDRLEVVDCGTGEIYRPSPWPIPLLPVFGMPRDVCISLTSREEKSYIPLLPSGLSHDPNTC